MNIKPYEEKKDTDPKNTVYLRLISDIRSKKINEVDLCIVNKQGEVIKQGVLLSIDEDITVYRQPMVNEMIVTNYDGRIIENKRDME